MTPARQLAYCLSALPSATGQRRADLEEKAAHLRRVLAGHCQQCGRHLTDPTSIAAGLGSHCRKHAA